MTETDRHNPITNIEAPDEASMTIADLLERVRDLSEQADAHVRQANVAHEHAQAAASQYVEERREAGSPAERRKQILQILAGLEPHEPGLSVNQLVELMPTYEIVITWSCPSPTQHDQWAECVHARSRHAWKPGYANVYQDLLKLEREERVKRCGFIPGSNRTVAWKAWSAVDEEDEAIASIMAAVRGVG